MNKQNLTFEMDFEMYDYIERAAENYTGGNKSEIVRRMINEFMDSVEV